MIKAVIFDLWNTLAEKPISISGTLKDYFGINNPNYSSLFENAMFRHKFKSKDEYAQTYCAVFNVPISEEKVEFIKKTIDEAIEGAKVFDTTRETLEDLSKDYKIGLISNTSQFEVLKPEWDLDKYFDVVQYSFQSGYLKPYPFALDGIASRLGCAPEECLFVDDMGKNVRAALDSGYTTYRMGDSSRLNTIGKKLKTYNNN